jgi:tetratricopeptide (TPR) repeat protein
MSGSSVLLVSMASAVVLASMALWTIAGFVSLRSLRVLVAVLMLGAAAALFAVAQYVKPHACSGLPANPASAESALMRRFQLDSCSLSQHLGAHVPRPIGPVAGGVVFVLLLLFWRQLLLRNQSVQRSPIEVGCFEFAVSPELGWSAPNPSAVTTEIRTMLSRQLITKASALSPRQGTSVPGLLESLPADGHQWWARLTAWLLRHCNPPHAWRLDGSIITDMSEHPCGLHVFVTDCATGKQVYAQAYRESDWESTLEAASYHLLAKALFSETRLPDFLKWRHPEGAGLLHYQHARAVRGGDALQERKELKLATHYDATNAHAWSELGSCCERVANQGAADGSLNAKELVGLRREAFNAYLKAVENGPEYVTGHYRLAVLLMTDGVWEAVENDYKTWLRSVPRGWIDRDATSCWVAADNLLRHLTRLLRRRGILNLCRHRQYRDLYLPWATRKRGQGERKSALEMVESLRFTARCAIDVEDGRTPRVPEETNDGRQSFSGAVYYNLAGYWARSFDGYPGAPLADHCRDSLADKAFAALEKSLTCADTPIRDLHQVRIDPCFSKLRQSRAESWKKITGSPGDCPRTRPKPLRLAWGARERRRS